MLPQVFSTILPMVKERKLAMRMICPVINHKLVINRPIKYIKQLINFIIFNYLKNKFKGKTNDCLVSIHDLDNYDKIDSNIYEYLISKTGKHKFIELMVHPFNMVEDKKIIKNYKLNENYSFADMCELEYNLLNRNYKVINNPKYKIVSYKEI